MSWEGPVLLIFGILFGILIFGLLGLAVYMVLSVNKLVKQIQTLQDQFIPFLSSPQFRGMVSNLSQLPSLIQLGVNQLRALETSFTSFTNFALERTPPPETPAAPTPGVGERGDLEFVQPPSDAAAFEAERAAGGGAPEPEPPPVIMPGSEPPT